MTTTIAGTPAEGGATMATIPTTAQRIKARSVAQALLVEAVKAGKTQDGTWVGSPEHRRRSALLAADYRDGFPDAYPNDEVVEARALIIREGSES